MAKKTVEVVKRESTALSNTNIPEHLQKYANMGSVGLENLQTEDMVMPRLAIAQSTHDEIKRGNPKRIEGLEEGMYFNTLTSEVYGDKVKLTPLFMMPSRIWFPPRGTEGVKQLCSARELDENNRLYKGKESPRGCEFCPHSEFLDQPRPDGSTRPDCTLFYNYISVIHKGNGVLEPISFSLKSKMIPPAKKWNSIMRLRNLPAFVQVFDLSSAAEKAAKGTFYQVVIQPAGNVSPEDIQAVENLFASYSKRNIHIDMRGAEVEDDFVVDGEERF